MIRICYVINFVLILEGHFRLVEEHKQVDVGVGARVATGLAAVEPHLDVEGQCVESFLDSLCYVRTSHDNPVFSLQRYTLFFM